MASAALTGGAVAVTVTSAALTRGAAQPTSASFSNGGVEAGLRSPDAFHEFCPKGERRVLVSGGCLDFPCLHLFKFKLICYLLVFSYSRQ